MTRSVRASAYGGPEVLAIQDIVLTGPGEGEVIATNVRGGYSEQVLVAGADVGHKPAALSFEEAAGLILAGATAWHLLMKTDVGTGDAVLIHAAGGGVGLMAVQLAAARGARVIATASPSRHDKLRGYGAHPVTYGPGLADRVRAIGTVDAALDLVGTDETLDTSVELVADRDRIATIAGFGRAAELAIAALTGADGGQEIRDAARSELIELDGRRQAGSVAGQGVFARRGRRRASLPVVGPRPRQSRTGSLASRS